MVTHKITKKIKPRYYPPMLATLVKESFSDRNWVFEKKFDGERCIAVKSGKEVILYSRNRKNRNQYYPELVAALKRQKRDFVVDGEIVAKSFAQLQTRMHRKTLKRGVPVTLYLFDALNVQGEDLRKKSLIERKIVLKRAISFSSKIRYVTHVKTKGKEAFQRAKNKKWEGIIAKRKDASYVSKRTREWLKFKCEKRATFFITGFTAPKGSRIGVGALILGYQRNGKMQYAGKVGTGFDSVFLEALAKKLKQIERKAPAFSGTFPKDVSFVSPKYRCQVAFTEWTNSGKLRHPRFLKMVRGDDGKN